MQIVELPYVTFSKVDKNMIKAIYKDSCDLNKKTLEEIREVYTEMHGDADLSELKLLIIFQGETKINLENGKEYMETRHRKKAGEAFVSQNPITNMYLNSVIQMVKPDFPIQVFSTEKEGLNWLSSL